MAKNNNLTDFLKDMADTIRSKTGTTDNINPQDFSKIITSIPSEDADVKIIDFDGTILYSYTKEQFFNLYEYPTPNMNDEKHANLIFDGYNFPSLPAAKQSLLDSSVGKLNIGAMYRTGEGAGDQITRFYISIQEYDIKDVELFFYQGSNGQIVIDWGDGSDEETIQDTGEVAFKHTYGGIGDYVIKINNTVYEAANLVFGCEYTSVFNNSKSAKLLKKVELGQCTYLDPNAFANCTSLETITTPLNNVYFYGEAEFYNCTSLKSFNCPNNTGISYNMFEDCYSLKYITGNPGYVNAYGFTGCFSLKEAFFPNASTIDEAAFYNCSSLEYVDFKIIATINYNAFYGCKSLKQIPFLSGYVDYYAFYDCKSLKSVIFNNYNYDITPYVFYGCTSLNAVAFFGTCQVTTIDSYAFANCTKLRIINIPDSVRTISTCAFQNCYSLVTVFFPASLITIGTSAFNNCSNIRYFDFSRAQQIPTLPNTNAFPVKSLDYKIIVPSSLYTNWKNKSNWTAFASKIVTNSSEIIKFSTEDSNYWEIYSYDYVDGYDLYSSYPDLDDDETSSMTLTISGYDTFTFYIASDAEQSYDFTIAGYPNGTIDPDDWRTWYTDTENNGNGSYEWDDGAGEEVFTGPDLQDLSSYVAVTYTGLNPNNTYNIPVMFKKDGSVSQGDNMGFALVPQAKGFIRN